MLKAMWAVLALGLLSPKQDVDELPQFVLKVGKPTARIFEPIFVTVRLENTRAAGTIHFGGTYPSFKGATYVEVAKAGGTFVRIVPSIEADVLTQDFELAPGKRFVAGDVLFLDQALAQAADIGADRLGARTLRLTQFLVAGSKAVAEPTYVKSGTQPFTILAPDSDADKAALQQLSLDDAFALFVELGAGRDENIKAAERLKQIVALQPTSHYAPASAYAAGAYYFQRRGSTATGKTIVLPDGTTATDLKRVMDNRVSKDAAEQLIFAAEKSDDSQLVLRARMKLAQLYLDLGRPKPAEANLAAADSLDTDGLFESERALLHNLLK
jgi:hypothetical protein